MFGRNRKPRPIVDLDMPALGDEWYYVEVDRGAEWAEELARTIATTPEDRGSLAADLEIVAQSQAALAAQGAGSWVLLRPDAPGRSIATMTYGVSEAGDTTPDAYEQMLASDEGHREPGVRIDQVRTWQVSIAAGVAVGAFNLLSVSDLVADGVMSQARTLFGVFPTGSSDVVEIGFTTDEIDQFDDFVTLTQGYVDSLVVELAK